MKASGRFGWMMVLTMLLISIPVNGRAASAHNELIPIGMLASLWGPTEDMLGLRDGLAERGMHQNVQVALGVRSAAGDASRLDALAQQLLHDGAKILYASGWEALAAAQRVTTRTPIVFTTWYDPVRGGAIATLGPNVTGVTHAFPELSPQALEVFRSLLPTLQRVLVPYAADAPHLAEPLQALRAAASRLGIALVERAVRTQAEAQEVIMGARQGEVDGILPIGGRLNIAGYALQACLQHHLPALFPRAWMAEYGGLASYGPSWYDLGRQAAHLLADIVRGSKPEELPVAVTEQMQLVINLRTAKALGITIPSTVLLRADKVIE